ncbi:hypothetical protein RJ639_019017 [Escallonia herrerae]|uniref:SART-1 family protein DOT2 n=1 Tax=Escallonia herrerae TaxID=1293975 RepID=A0AA88VD41_9ASTE|nr:hypothetical protein RJ639_019017 [Escallonia herrerae]
MRDQDESSMRERRERGYDELEDHVEKSRDSGKHRSKERSKSSRREEKDHRSRDPERLKTDEKDAKDSQKHSNRERRKEDRDDPERGRIRDKVGEKDGDRDKYKDKERKRDKDRGKEEQRERDRDTEKDRDRGRDKDRGKERSRDRDKEKEKERDRGKDREREKGREKHRDKERDRENERDRDRDKDALDKEKGKERFREEMQDDQDEERYREKDKVSWKHRDGLKLGDEDGKYSDLTKQVTSFHHEEAENGTPKHDAKADGGGSNRPVLELEERILKMKEERLKKKSEGVSEVLGWVNKSRKLEEKMNAEKEKALHLSKAFEEQDNIDQGESEDESTAQPKHQDLAGVKVLHGLDKVMEGGAVVLTLKDQSILAAGDINQEVDMLENVEIGEQKLRDEAYKAAKKKTGTYDDKFNEEPGSERKMLPQYDDVVADEGVSLDASGRFTGEAEKKLEELRRRIEGVPTVNPFQDLNSSAKVSSEYYTNEEILKFKKPKKRKSLRKKDKLDIDALEAEAVSAGLGAADLGSRKDAKRQVLKEEEERSEALKRSNAYQSAYAKADQASKTLRLGQTLTVQKEEDDTQVFGDDDEDLRKSLERARKIALKKQDDGQVSGTQSITLLASSTGNNSTADNENTESGEPQEKKLVFTEMEEFVWGLQLDEEAQKPDGEDVFMEEDVAPEASGQEPEDVDGGWTEVKETGDNEILPNQDKEEGVPDETIHEASVGKGLSGALKLLKDRGTFKETVEWGGRNMDKKKSKLVGIYESDGKKEIHIERTDEYGRILTPKEAFRQLSHKFHGKGPGKGKQEKRMRQYQEELKVKQMKNADTPSSSVERMREAQAQLKTPYLVLSGHVKPGQTSDPRSGFATVEKDHPGGLTPMLGDRKVEHFLGIKRKPESGDMGPPKKQAKPSESGDMDPPKKQAKP